MYCVHYVNSLIVLTYTFCDRFLCVCSLSIRRNKREVRFIKITQSDVIDCKMNLMKQHELFVSHFKNDEVMFDDIHMPLLRVQDA